MDNQLEDLLTCSICLEVLNKPKALPCQHTFCDEPCMKHFIQGRAASGLVSCPVCRRTHSIPNGGFPTNFHFEQLLAMERGQSSSDAKPTASVHDFDFEESRDNDDDDRHATTSSVGIKEPTAPSKPAYDPNINKVILEQAKLENCVTITGFKSPPNDANLLDALKNLFDVKPQLVRSFKINAKTGREMTITNLTFASQIEKRFLFAARNAKGILKVSNFFPYMSPEEGADENVCIGHTFTKANIQIRKLLDVLKAEKKIMKKRFRNNKHQFQKEPNDPWQDALSIEDLKKLFP